jgi:uncharacterized membrane protein YbjE (DUF340 family)
MSKIPFILCQDWQPTLFWTIALQNTFEIYLLEWEIPLDNESLTHYAKRISEKIKHENPVLIGVSFGGILVQEMSKHLNASKYLLFRVSK